jgi:hypothetical protein
VKLPSTVVKLLTGVVKFPAVELKLSSVNAKSSCMTCLIVVVFMLKKSPWGVIQ